MTPELANITLQFLSRVQLQGNEVQAFNTVVAELQPIAAKFTSPESEPKKEKTKKTEK